MDQIDFSTITLYKWVYCKDMTITNIEGLYVSDYNAYYIGICVIQSFF